MIGSSLFSSVMQLVFKPVILIPAFIMLIASIAVSSISGAILDRHISDFLVYSINTPQDNLVGILLFNYPLELLGMIVIGSIMLIIGSIMMIATARIAKGDGLIEALNESAIEINKSIGLMLVFWAAAVIISAAFAVSAFIGGVNDTLGLIVNIIFIIIIFVAFVKLVFTIPALSGKDLKKALGESWKFTSERFWKSVLLIVLAVIISTVIAVILNMIGPYLGEVGDLVFSFVGDSVAFAFFVAVITNYFYSK